MSNFTKDSTATEVAEALATHITGKVVLITGCSPSGLGVTAANAIAPQHPALIILAGRNRSLIEETQKTLLEKTPNLKTRILIFDLGNLQSVRDVAKEVNNYPEKIDVLINNAGIMAAPCSKTVDGFESQFGINHLGPFLFTMLVVDKMNHGGRVVNVSSAGYAFGGVRFNDPNFESGEYHKWQAYAQSKTANILFSSAFAERFGSKGLLSFSLHVGGGIMTNLGRHMTPEDFVMLSFVTIVSHEQGAASYIAAAFDPTLEASNGAYLEHCKPVPTSPQCPWTRGKENEDNLWSLSEKLVGEKFGI